MRKYGLKLDTIEPEHYMLGSNSPIPLDVLQVDKDWSEFLPTEEPQNLNGIEPYACVTFTILNCVEILIKRKYGIEVNFSDRFLAEISGTKEGGNSPQVVCEFLRKIGVVPESMWPFDTLIKSFEDFYAPLPPSLVKLAKEFTDTWDFKHEFVPATHEDISAALQCSPLLISVSAWHLDDETQLFYRPAGSIDNHATTLIYEKDGQYRRVFDSYGDPFLKSIEWKAIPMQVKRFWIEKKSTPPLSGKESLYAKIIRWFTNLLKK